jgi:hypothetical protein
MYNYLYVDSYNVIDFREVRSIVSDHLFNNIIVIFKDGVQVTIKQDDDILSHFGKYMLNEQ